LLSHGWDCNSKSQDKYGEKGLHVQIPFKEICG